MNQGWSEVLTPGEKLLWHDRPAPGVQLGDFFSPLVPFGAVFTAFAVFWIGAASWMGRGTGGLDIFPLFGVPFVLVGLYMMIGVPIWDSYERSRSWYALSDQAAYIATELFGRRSLKRYPVVDMNALELVDATQGIVWFRREMQVHTATRRSRNGLPSRRTYVSTSRVGFKRITNARAVYVMIARLVDRQSAAMDAKEA